MKKKKEEEDKDKKGAVDYSLFCIYCLSKDASFLARFIVEICGTHNLFLTYKITWSAYLINKKDHLPFMNAASYSFERTTT